MPVLVLHSPRRRPPDGLLDRLRAEVADAVAVPTAHVWAWWQAVEDGCHSRPEWAAGGDAPVVLVHCRAAYLDAEIAEMARRIQRTLVALLPCRPEDVYVGVHPLPPGHVLVRDTVWAGAR